MSSCFVKTSNRIQKYKITSPWEITEADLFDVVGLPCSQLFEQWCFRFKGKIELKKLEHYQLLLFGCLFFPLEKGILPSQWKQLHLKALYGIINNNEFFSLCPPPTHSPELRRDALSKRGNCTGKVNKNSLLHINYLTSNLYRHIRQLKRWVHGASTAPPICDLPPAIPDSRSYGQRTKKKPYKNKSHFKWILKFTAKLISSNTVWLSIKQTNCSKVSQASHQTISSWVCSVRTFPQSAHAGVDRKKKKYPSLYFS